MTPRAPRRYESKRSLFDEAVPGQRAYDPKSSIFEIAKNLAAATESSTVRVSDVENRAVMKGFTARQIQETLDAYADLSVWQVRKTPALPRAPPCGLGVTCV